MQGIKSTRPETSRKQSTCTQKQLYVMQIQYSTLTEQHVPPNLNPLTPGFAALKQHDKTIADASAALSLNPDYSKALRRRAHAYEETGHDEEALSDWTATCIVEEFKFADCTNAVQRVLKRLADRKVAERLQHKVRKLPSPNFVLAYLSSFRPKPTPALPEMPGDGDFAFQRAMEHVENAEFNKASDKFDEAIKLGCAQLPLALNYSGTFAFIRGDSDAAMEDFDRSIELDKNQAQVYVKRASVYMEQGKANNGGSDNSQP
jgi:mitochondrial import receptor subunit TOM70